LKENYMPILYLFYKKYDHNEKTDFLSAILVHLLKNVRACVYIEIKKCERTLTRS
jgi:hypothetical protein